MQNLIDVSLVDNESDWCTLPLGISRVQAATAWEVAALVVMDLLDHSDSESCLRSYRSIT